MSRVQLALRVADLERSVLFYSKLFGVEPAKRRPGYANFAIAEPPLKLVLLEGEAQQDTAMDHLVSRSSPPMRSTAPPSGSRTPGWPRSPRPTPTAATPYRTKYDATGRAGSRGRSTSSRPTAPPWRTARPTAAPARAAPTTAAAPPRTPTTGDRHSMSRGIGAPGDSSWGMGRWRLIG